MFSGVSALVGWMTALFSLSSWKVGGETATQEAAPMQRPRSTLTLYFPIWIHSETGAAEVGGGVGGGVVVVG